MTAGFKGGATILEIINMSITGGEALCSVVKKHFLPMLSLVVLLSVIP